MPDFGKGFHRKNPCVGQRTPTAVSQIRPCWIAPAAFRAEAGRRMKTVAEYRQYAEECRRLAPKVPQPEDKKALEAIARAWDRVADEREAHLLKQINDRSGLDA